MRAISTAIGAVARFIIGAIGVFSGAIGSLIVVYSLFYPSIHAQSSATTTEIYLTAQYFAVTGIGLLLIAVFCVLLIMSPHRPAS